jgi:hypothetical protein
MKLCLLAPLPSEHASDALAVAKKVGVVALGTGDMGKDDGGVYMFEFFNQIAASGLMGMLPVYIQVSLSGRKPPADYFVGQKASMAGTLVSYAGADNFGRHKYPEERPQSALATDTALGGFWRVSGLELLPASQHLELSKFRTARDTKGIPTQGGKIDYILRGPILAFAPEK